MLHTRCLFDTFMLNILCTNPLLYFKRHDSTQLDKVATIRTSCPCPISVKFKSSSNRPHTFNIRFSWTKLPNFPYFLSIKIRSHTKLKIKKWRFCTVWKTFEALLFSTIRSLNPWFHDRLFFWYLTQAMLVVVKTPSNEHKNLFHTSTLIYYSGPTSTSPHIRLLLVPWEWTVVWSWESFQLIFGNCKKVTNIFYCLCNAFYKQQLHLGYS